MYCTSRQQAGAYVALSMGGKQTLTCTVDPVLREEPGQRAVCSCSRLISHFLILLTALIASYSQGPLSER